LSRHFADQARCLPSAPMRRLDVGLHAAFGMVE
jgi:hypothetical protein